MARRARGSPTPVWPPLVVPVALYRPGDALSAVLRRYKDAPVAVARRHHAMGLTRLLDSFMARHGPCLEAASGPWDALAVVPSSRTPAAPATGRRLGLRGVPHPLEAVLDAADTLGPIERIGLAVDGAPPAHLRPSSNGVVVTGAAAGRRVLVLDDTWTTGAHALSVAAALARAGAVVVAVVVLGRAVDPLAGPGVTAWWERVTAATGPPGCCCLEGRD